MKIIFAGTPQFAAVSLNVLLSSSHEVIAVYTQPDKPAGRGLKVAPSPVKEVANAYSIPVYQPLSLKEGYEQDKLAHFHADIMVVVAYGMLIPAAVLKIPRLGCINVHSSLLPRWRGAAPIQRAIFAGDTITGITIMQMDAGLDTGPILFQKQYVIQNDETSQTLHDQLAQLGAHALIQTLGLLDEGKIIPQIQSNESTYANKITKEEALIDWTKPAIELEREIRAFNPWPVAYTSWKGQHLRIWQAKVIPEDSNAEPRTIVQASNTGIDIATGKGILRLLKVQLPGGKVLSVSDFYNAKRNELIVGERLI